MAESEKGASSTANAKQKSSLLGDMDFGKDFFTSWDTNVAGDDGMDFDFGTAAKGKKKAFNFDKLDMDFSLDGDLDKISSFKVDMSDLDISSPVKKSGTTEKSKEGSADGNKKSKRDTFSFSFDFNELDTFQFEPSSKKEETKVSKNKDGEEGSNRREGQSSRTEQPNDIGKFANLDSDISGSEGVTISKVKPTASNLEKNDFTDHSPPIETKAAENGASKPPTNEKTVESEEEVTLAKTMSCNSAQEIDQDTICQQESTFPRSYTRERAQVFSIKSVSEDQTTQAAYSELQAEVSSRATNDPVAEKNTDIDSAAAPDLENPLMRQGKSVEKLGSDDSERNICGDNDAISDASKDFSAPAQGDTESADTSSTNTLRKFKCVTESRIKHQNEKSEGGESSADSETSKLIEMKEKETGIVRSKFFKRSSERESQRRQIQPSQTSLAMFPAKLMGSKQQTDGRKAVSESIEAQGGNKVTRESASFSGETTKGESGETESPRSARTDTGGLPNGVKSVCSKLNEKELTRGEPVLRLDKDETNLVPLKDVSESIDAQVRNKESRGSPSLSGEVTKGESGETDNVRSVGVLKGIGGILNGSKSACSKLNEKESVRGESLRTLDKNTKDLLTLSSSSKSPSSIEQLPKPTTQIHAAPRTVPATVSLKSSLNISGEGYKVSAPKTNRSLPDLSSLRISRTLRVSTSPSNTSGQKETNSSRNLKQIGQPEVSAPSKISPTISTEKQSWSSPSLKRKTYEASNVDILNTKPLKRLSPSNAHTLNTNPLKRFSQSPTESRNVRELIKDINKEVRNSPIIAKNHNIDCDQPSTMDITPELDLADLKMHLVIERDDNVEKAEAYAKDLEDMCNTLKKKHEEAKELLVRAVVNNSNLLMLNHPMYEEMICKMQKCAMQNDVQGCLSLTSQNNVY